METVKRSVVARDSGEREGGMDSWSTRDVEGGETTLYDTVMVDA